MHNPNLNDDGSYHKKPILIRSLLNYQIRTISAGWGHSAVSTIDGKVLMCGRNYRGQIGKKPDDCEKNSRGHPYSPNFELINGINDKINKVVCGGEHTAAITSEGKLYLWGDDTYGQLGSLLSRNNLYNNNFYKEKPVLVEGEPSIGNVKDVILGSSITFYK